MYHLYTAPRNIIGLQIAITKLNEKENHEMKIPHLSRIFFLIFLKGIIRRGHGWDRKIIC